MTIDKQKYNICTIFDYSYLAKGLALFDSLNRHCNCHVFVFTPDLECKKFLIDLGFQNLSVIDFAEIETSELLKVKSERDAAEYFWTIKGVCLEYLLDRFKLDFITYIDADTYFYASPEPLFQELANNSVLILPHNFSPRYSHEIINGIYNAGFISFKNDEMGLTALRWWKDKSIAWCYRRKEKDRFGDQMYLNEMAGFKGVHAINNKGCLANWNVQQYSFEKEKDKILGKTALNEKFEVIFYHFHYMKFIEPDKVELGRKFISKEVLELFYKPYIRILLTLAPWKAQGATAEKISIKTPLVFIARKIRNNYNVFRLNRLMN